MSAIRVHLSDHILHLTLARAEKKNALNSAMYEAMTQALIDAEGNSGVHAVLFDAEGDTFTAGNDLSEFAAVASGALNPSELHAVKFLDVLTRGTKPYVAAVQGAAVGIGTTLLLHCDLVYVAQDARLSTPFANLALVPEAGSSVLLPARIGHVRAFAMFALGESIDGRTAASLGLANEAVPASELGPRALAAAKALASKPIGALQATKKLMRDADAIRAIMAREVEVFRERLKTAEARQAFDAFASRKNV
jgi:enoyl-CoA hydratase/carnithine racemase